MATASFALLSSATSLPRRECSGPVLKNSWISSLPFGRSCALRGGHANKCQKFVLEPRSMHIQGIGSSRIRPLSRKIPVAAAYDRPVGLFPVSDEVHAEGSIKEGEKRPGSGQDSVEKLNGERSEATTSDEEGLNSSRNATEELHKQVEKVESLTAVAEKAIDKEKESLPGAMESSSVQEQSRKGAKIHDFCFGIPYGGLLAGGGLLGYFITRNAAALVYSLLFGGAVLGLSITSLKVWKQGKTSSPYILGQAALAFILLARQLQVFSLTKNIFPTGLIAIISAAMLGFYSYVYMSGGNPPPKKLKSAPVT